MEVNITLVDDLLARADTDSKLSTTAVAKARKDRATQCGIINPNCTFGPNEKQTAFLQAALLLEALGEGDFISVDHARSFLVEEKIPSDYVKSAVSVSVATLTANYGELVGQAAHTNTQIGLPFAFVIVRRNDQTQFKSITCRQC
ncbi:hypothetical protein PHYPSEUDO_014780 [Phytophthora pseudosyringae]|uniref:Heme haloperoxidase family profile domain-containing protein n=1 Tax=Phytophthora pseudosyringae TaxID=221518 RepID=A0A8T1V4Q4_9STRA|nr:hypothetical protein PHYPSEUDO_014780 [Phytophthora pseudosyringae]